MASSLCSPGSASSTHAMIAVQLGDHGVDQFVDVVAPFGEEVLEDLGVKRAAGADDVHQGQLAGLADRHRAGVDQPTGRS